MADKITWANEKRKLSELIPWPRNPRQIKDAQAKRLVQSFDEFGQVETIAIGPDNGVYNGHQRLNVLASKYGRDYQVEVRVSSRPLDEKEREKLTIFLHKGAAGEMDFDKLANEFELDDLLEWGYDKKELDIDLWAGEQPEDPGAQIDKAEELREKWGVESGQLWRLGEHRLICGDCTDRAVVERVGKVDALFTDPPYGIAVDVSWLSTLNVKRGKPANMSDDKLLGDDGSIDLSFLFNYDRRMIWGFPYIYDPSASGWIVWDKQPGVNERGIVTPIEMASTTMRSGFDMIRVMWGGYYRAAGEKRVPHPTQKPVTVIEPFISDWTKSEEIIYDPFLGSGTTLIACERLKRKCRAVEISPAYCAVAIQRWVDMTGGIPEIVE